METRREKVDKYRKRSMVWSYFKNIDPVSVQCLLCSRYLHRQDHGSTTPMLRHLRLKHSAEVPRRGFGLEAEGAAGQEPHCVEIDGDQIMSVVVEMEDGASDTKTLPGDSDASPAVGALREASHEDPEEQTPAERGDDSPVKHTRRRSLIWRLFEHVESLNAARCRICMKKLLESGGISNLRRHLRKRHPKVLSELLASSHEHPAASSLEAGDDSATQGAFLGTENMQVPVKVVVVEEVPEVVTENRATNGLPDAFQQGSPQIITPAEKGSSVQVGSADTSWNNTQKWIPVEALGGGSADVPTPSNETDIRSAINGLLETLNDGSDKVARAGEGEDQSAKQSRRRSLIWQHFERLENLEAAQCRICMKKLKCFESSCTGNLHRHMSKRHPKVFSKLASNRQQHPSPSSSFKDGANENLTVRKHDQKKPALRHSVPAGGSEASRESEVESRVLKQERELIEALRRTQREEARTLDQQRELVEKLRAAGAREAAAEKEKIESLRKAQQEEAKELSRQREELEKEKAELQKMWGELQREREELLLPLDKDATG
ncbi:zinc finger BED domain-containing protein [Kryptolebias marmoratus]|uniref:Uncharacterized LOC108250767 n=1 Tax=Kryptolebias marmoratus TaxID=37003 RepID=A0A3Q3A5Z6_KRYMA|nr:zinc finger BED domain-containing protein [Kryptolebias marmoratus]